VAESFFHTLKTELVYQHRYRAREEARLAIFDYIAAFTIAPVGTPVMPIAHPTTRKPSMLPAYLGSYT